VSVSYIFRTASVVALAAFVAVILQVTVAGDVAVLGGGPDLVCILVCSVALLRGPELGAAVGFGCGLLLDAVAGLPLGYAALVYCCVGYAAGRLSGSIGDRAALRPLLVIAVGTVAANAGLVLTGFLLPESGVGLDLLVSPALITSAALGVLLGIPLYPAVRGSIGARSQPRPRRSGGDDAAAAFA
jgi:rod shape-determining protein MreD